MPIFKIKNENFFKTWSGDMAYVLGFFAADGSMYKNRRGGCYIEFQITDRKLIEKIRFFLGPDHKIAIRTRSARWKPVYRLQIGSKTIFEDLGRLGFTQNKSKTIRFPKISDEYFNDFLRGYFDGDGSVTFGYFKKADRSSPGRTFLTRFTSGSRLFLIDLQEKLLAHSIKGSLYAHDGAWQLSYSCAASKKLFLLMYKNNRISGLIYLKRKYKIFQDALASKGHAGVA